MSESHYILQKWTFILQICVRNCQVDIFYALCKRLIFTYKTTTGFRPEKFVARLWVWLDTRRPIIRQVCCRQLHRVGSVATPSIALTAGIQRALSVLSASSGEHGSSTRLASPSLRVKMAGSTFLRKCSRNLVWQFIGVCRETAHRYHLVESTSDVPSSCGTLFNMGVLGFSPEIFWLVLTLNAFSWAKTNLHPQHFSL